MSRWRGTHIQMAGDILKRQAPQTTAAAAGRDKTALSGGTSTQRMQRERTAVKALIRLLEKESDERSDDDVFKMATCAETAVPFLSRLPPIMRRDMCRSVVMERCRKGDVIFHQGEMGTHLYILLAGKISLDEEAVGDGSVSSMRELGRIGDSFGEITLLQGQPRTLTARVASKEATLMKLSKDDFLRALSDNLSRDMMDRMAEVRRVQLFDHLCTDEHLMAIAPFFSFVPFRKGQIFFPDREGRIFIIHQGAARLCEMKPPEKPDRRSTTAAMRRAEMAVAVPTTICRLYPHMYFGETCLSEDLQRGWVVECTGDVVLLSISKQDFLERVDWRVHKAMYTEALFRIGMLDERFEHRRSDFSAKTAEYRNRKNSFVAALAPKMDDAGAAENWGEAPAAAEAAPVADAADDVDGDDGDVASRQGGMSFGLGSRKGRSGEDEDDSGLNDWGELQIGNLVLGKPALKPRAGPPLHAARVSSAATGVAAKGTRLKEAPSRHITLDLKLPSIKRY